jgi:hypothetical protein
MSNYDPNENPYRNLGSPNVEKPDFSKQSPPAVITWQMVYCGLMALMYFVVAAGGVFFVVMAGDLPDVEMSQAEASLFGGIFAVMGLGLGVLFGAGLFFRRGNFAWVFHIVLIAIGLMSACCWPTNIPLLIYWIKHKDYIVNSGG